VNVSGTGFPPSTALTVGAGIVDLGPVVSQPVATDASGNFAAQLTIPASAASTQAWSIFASQPSGTELITVQAPFRVTFPAAASVYVVQPGDILSDIALRYNITWILCWTPTRRSAIPI
jgi:LysM repeat protein